jgi:hypothetical protein
MRAQLDAAIAHQASTAGKGLESQARDGLPASGCLLHLQQASQRALLASALAPCMHRPPFLPLALHLFRQVYSAVLLESLQCTPCLFILCLELTMATSPGLGWVMHRTMLQSG